MTYIDMIVAADANDVIAVDGKIPWDLPEDRAFFRAATMGRTVVMGRKTYDTIGKPLDGRLNIVMTRDEDWTAPGVIVAHTVERVLELLEIHGGSPCIIGGGEIYTAFGPHADRLIISRVIRAENTDGIDEDRITRLDPGCAFGGASKTLFLTEDPGFNIETYEK